MPYTIIALELTAEQQAAISAAVNPAPSPRSFGLLAQPYISGEQSGKLMVYIITPEQYALIAEAVNNGYKLSAYVPKR